MNYEIKIQTIAYAIVVVSQFWLFLVWLNRKRDEVTRNVQFLKELRENHLTHIYSALRAICKKLDIDFEEPRS